MTSGRLDFRHRAVPDREAVQPFFRQTADPPRPRSRPAGRTVTFRLWAGGDPVSSWVEEIQAGTDAERNFERLFRHFRPRVIRFFSERGLEPALCEELTQDTFLRAFDHLHHFERRSQFSTWLFEIAKNVFNNELRSRQAAKRDGYELPL